jgi:hypothetical protein
MQAVVVEPKKFDKQKMQTNVEIPVGRGKEVTYPFQWLLFKPQSHAITPFSTHQQTRLENTDRN